MNRRLATALVAGITSLGVMAPMAPAQAHTHNCVKKKEFKRAKQGMTMPRVAKIFDIKGRQIFIGGGYQSREYKSCTEYGAVWVDYERRNGSWRVSDKYALW